MKLYRYSSNLFDSNNIKIYHTSEYCCVYLHEYDSIRDTKCGVWILQSGGVKKFVNLEKVKQYASKTPEDAKINFLARKKRQICILESQLIEVKDSILALDTQPLDYSTYMTFDFVDSNV